MKGHHYLQVEEERTVDKPRMQRPPRLVLEFRPLWRVWSEQRRVLAERVVGQQRLAAARGSGGQSCCVLRGGYSICVPTGLPF